MAIIQYQVAAQAPVEQPRYRWDIKQGGKVIASGEAPCEAAFRYAMHTASVYLQDGPLSLAIKPVRPAKRGS